MKEKFSCKKWLLIILDMWLNIHLEIKRINSKDAEKAYDTANKLAHSCLSPTHPIRLGLALNYSVFFYEIKQNAAKAC